jgi:hypothetical protein
VYLGLFTAFTQGNDGDTFTEVTGGGYARQAITFGVPAAGSTANTNTITFPEATAGQGTVTEWGIFDAASGGNMLYWGDSTDISVLTGETFSVDPGNLTVSLSGNIHQTYAHTILSATLRAGALAIPTVHVALLTAFTNDTTYTECPDASYVRRTATFAVPSNGLSDNAADITYPAMTAQQVITHTAIFDALTVGNMIFRGPLSASKTVGASKVFKFPTGALDITLA